MFFKNPDCQPRDGDPSANYNTILGNKFRDNRKIGVPSKGIPEENIIYLQSLDELGGQPNENCFQNNTELFNETQPASFFAFEFTGEEPMPLLPTGGCEH